MFREFVSANPFAKFQIGQLTRETIRVLHMALLLQFPEAKKSLLNSPLINYLLAASRRESALAGAILALRNLSD